MTIIDTLSASHLGRFCTGLFAVSTMFPIAASVYPADPPRWLGVVDVGVAAVLVLAAIALGMLMQNRVVDGDRVRAFRISQLVIGAIPVLLVLFFLVGPRIKWDVLVVGLAWRLWFLLYSLPYLIAAERTALQLHEARLPAAPRRDGA